MNSMFDLFQLIAENVWLYGGAFVLVLSILVFVHEWGHYIVARKCGVHIDVFSIGFGREIVGWTDKSGTRWKISLIPLGGYVKMFGDVDPASFKHTNGIEDEDTKETRPLTTAESAVAFYTQPVAKRLAIVFAGPAINFIFAVVLLAGLYGFYGQPVTPPLAAAVVGDSAAAEAGFMPHDEVIAIDGRTIRRFEDIRREVVVGLDTPRVFKIRRGEDIIEIKAAPRRIEQEDRFGFKNTRGLLGLISVGNAIDISRITAVDGREIADGNDDVDVDKVRKLLLSKMGQTYTILLDHGKEVDKLIINPLATMNEALNNPESPEYDYLVIASTVTEVFVQHGPVDSVVEAINETVNVTVSTLEALWQMITGTRSATELGGLIRIGAIAGDMAKAGIVAMITFTALLSINLGLINLFPIPMLDGGHILFFLIEAVKGSPIPDQIQEYAFRLGLALLAGIMLFANLNDIIQLIL